MVIQCTCDCDCSDRDTRSSCLPRLVQRQRVTPLAAGNDMEHRLHTSYFHRRLSNTSSVLYGSCPQLLPVEQPSHNHNQSRAVQQKELQQQLEEQQQELRPYSSLVRTKHRSSVLCNKCAL
ncbi:uncharacterized protein LOC122322450 [Drosophila grimshawi]|uniref:uncharacterized protein LOC122322450 n=1 Tax=Drosophila grimshawi TaxID=7222 RepID=UPI001C9346CE|nr:uncharacterized protein LOC122322450 [Drosophila grimshawi]